MKVSDKLHNTIMNDEDKAHVEWIARRHGIEFLDHTMAMMIAARSGQQEILTHAASFSTADQNGTLKGLYLDPGDAETEEQAYFIALHELGHSVLKHHNNGADDVTNEIDAWDWALKHAQRLPQEDETWEEILNALSTYTDYDEAKRRPDSLLALAASPDIWQERGYKFKQFKLPAMEGMDPVQLIGKDGSVREVPQPLAKMIAEYIQFCKDCEVRGFLAQMTKVFNDPDMVGKIERAARAIGSDAKTLKDELDRQYLKSVESKVD